MNNVNFTHHSLKEPILQSLRLVEGFLGYISSKPERMWMKPRI